MGRFFQAQPVQLAKDNMYAPPFEMMLAAMTKKDNDIQQQADTLELLRDLPIDRLDYHKEGAENIKKELHGQIDEIAQNIQKNLLSPENKSQLNNLKRTIQQRYDSGDIYNIQQSAKNFREFEKKLDSDKNMTSALKEKHISEYWNDYANRNPNGAYKDVYTPGPIIDDVDGLQQYTDWFKNLKPDEKKNIVEKAGGKWNVLTETERDGVVLENGFKDFIASTPNLKDAYLQQGKSNIYKDRNLLKPDGSLNFESGHLANIVKSAKELNYTSRTDSEKLEENPYYKWEIDRADAKAKEAQQNKIAQLFEINKDASEIYNNSVAVRNHEKTYLDKLKNGLTFGKAVPDNINDFISILERTKNKSVVMINKLNEAKGIQRDVQNAMKASYAPLYNGGADEKTVEKLKKGLNENLIANGQSQKYRLPPMQIMDKNGKTTNVVLKDGYQEFIPKNMVGKYKMTPDGRKLLIKNVTPVANSVIPILLNSPSSNGRSINDNDAHVTLNFTLQGEDGKDFTYTQTAYYNMNEGAGFSQP